MALTSTQRLQAAMVRLLTDPAAVAALSAGRTLPGLLPDEAATLRAVDPRAWSVDGHRRARLLHAVIDELPVTVGLLGVDAADAYLSSAAFHRVLTDHGSLVLGFGAWAAARSGAPGRLELDLARARRWRPPRGEGLARAASVGVFQAPAGTLDAVVTARSLLGADPVSALAAGARVPPPRPRGGRGASERWIVTPGVDGEAIERAPDALAELLAPDTRRSRSDVEAHARRLGAGEESAAIVASLVQDGLLVG